MATHDPSSSAKLDICAIVEEDEQSAISSWQLAKPALPTLSLREKGGPPGEIANYKLQITNPPAAAPPRQPGSILIPWIFAAAEGIDRKIQGEQAECAFVWRAMEQGLIVSKPYGDSAPYDFIVQRRIEIRRRSKRAWTERSDRNPAGRYCGRTSRGQLWRVQVKCTRVLDANGRYYLNVRRASAKPYSELEVDFVAAWIDPEDAWYIIPIEAISPATCAHLTPHRRGRGRLEKYREAWALLA